MSISCNSCGNKNINTSKFCSTCGKVLYLKSGTILENRYKILTLIKEGGMGAVYKATDEKLDSICVVKELLPVCGTEEEQKQAIKWFNREAKLLAKLDHANLPRVSDYFVSDGRYYLVMTFIDGEDLETVLKREGKPGLSEEKVIEWAKQILQVLDYLHTQTPPVVYRDIKPPNIMLHKDGRVMLIDFGIARNIQCDSQTAKTTMGTEGYAPLEQHRGKAETRSDLYALGATIHHLLTGIKPLPFLFEPLRKIIPAISVDLENVVMKALKTKIEDRFFSAKDMLQAISFKEQIYKKNGFTCASKIQQIVPPPTAPLKSGINKSLILRPEMILIPGGTFHMGSNTRSDEQPVHKVQLSSFYMGKYEITNTDYCLFLNSQGYQTEGNVTWVDIKIDPYCGIKIGQTPGAFIVKSGYEKRPVVYVSWYGAVAYCNWLSEQEKLQKCYGEKDNRGNADRIKSGYRLPFEAEWEYACRAGTTSEYYWGHTINDNYCWYGENSADNHHDIGLRKSNVFGLYDMIGNVWEWCCNWYWEYYSNYIVNPIGPDKGVTKVRRGGSWNSVAINCRNASRDYDMPDFRSNLIGFRLTRTA